MRSTVVLNGCNPTETLHLEIDEPIDYRTGRSSCYSGNEILKKCSSWHSWGYALETEFLVYGKSGWQNCYKYDNIIILVNRNMASLIPLVKKLKIMKKKVAVAFHEGPQDLMNGSGVGENIMNRWVEMYDLVKEADKYINIFGQMQPMFEGWFGNDKVIHCHHGAPVDWNHTLSTPWNQRPYDIVVGTRTFGQRLSRNTFVSLTFLNKLAKEGKSVHFVGEDGGETEPLLKRIGMENIVVHKGPFKWTEWLKFISQFKILYHHDNSSNLGQICLDAVLVDTIPVGSTTWNNILLNTQDDADLRRAETIIEDLLDQKDNTMKRWEYENIHKPNFIKEIHPETIKNKLLKAFE